MASENSAGMPGALTAQGYESQQAAAGLRALARRLPHQPLAGGYYEQCNRLFRQCSNQQQLMLDWALKNVPVDTGNEKTFAVLSIGCGCGLFDLPFLEGLRCHYPQRGIRYHGLDYNAVQLRPLARSLAQISAVQATLDPVAFEQWDTEQGFDCVLLVHTLYYMRNPTVVLDRARHLLKPGGRVLLFSAERGGLNYAAQVFAGSGAASTNDYVFHDTVDRYLRERAVIGLRECLPGVLNAELAFTGMQAQLEALLSFIAQADLRAGLNSQAKAEFREWMRGLRAADGGPADLSHPVWAYAFN